MRFQILLKPSVFFDFQTLLSRKGGYHSCLIFCKWREKSRFSTWAPFTTEVGGGPCDVLAQTGVLASYQASSATFLAGRSRRTWLESSTWSPPAPWGVGRCVRMKVGGRRKARWPWDHCVVVKVLTLPGPLLTLPRREREESASLPSVGMKSQLPIQSSLTWPGPDSEVRLPSYSLVRVEVEACHLVFSGVALSDITVFSYVVWLEQSSYRLNIFCLVSCPFPGPFGWREQAFVEAPSCLCTLAFHILLLQAWDIKGKNEAKQNKMENGKFTTMSFFGFKCPLLVCLFQSLLMFVLRTMFSVSSWTQEEEQERIHLLHLP